MPAQHHACASAATFVLNGGQLGGEPPAAATVIVIPPGYELRGRVFPLLQVLFQRSHGLGMNE